MSDKEERLAKLEKLLEIFDTPVLGQDGMVKLNCPECDKILKLRDKFESGGGGGDFYTPLYFCKNCGYHEIGERTWTSDY